MKKKKLAREICCMCGISDLRDETRSGSRETQRNDFSQQTHTLLSQVTQNAFISTLPRTLGNYLSVTQCVQEVADQYMM